MKFEFEKTESTASPLYLAKAINDDGIIEMQWKIVCDDESQLEEIAKEAYDLFKAPKTYQPANILYE